MALKIIEKEGLYMVDGPINANTLEALKNHIELLLTTNKGLKIKINKVLDSDFIELSLLRQYYNNSKLQFV